MSARITTDKPYDLMGEVTPRMILNIDEMLGQLYWYVTQLESKITGSEGLLSSQNTSITQEILNAYGSAPSGSSSSATSFSHWPVGPWTFGETVGAASAYLDAGTVPTGTYNDFDPGFMDSTVVLDIEPDSGTVTLTGLRARTDYKPRLILIRNVDTSNNLTLKHLNSGSIGRNQFRLPSNVDVTVGPRQAIWLFFDPSAGLWTSAITSHVSGGLALAGAAQSATITLSQSQIEAANTTPITIVSAPGAGILVVPIMFSVICNVTSAYGTNPNWSIRYSGVANDIGNAVASQLNSTGVRPCFAGVASEAFTTDVRNLAIVLRLSSDPTGGAAAGVATCTYFTVDASSV